MRILYELFDHAERLRGTSLHRQHRSRVMYLRHTAQGGSITSVRFGIVRHPRPYPFSRQFHEVLELWTYDVSNREVRRERGVNLSRMAGADGEPAGSGPDF
ncbi:MAG: hypothetical protein U1E76_13505 [Planctomycetota bacterium]